MIKVHKSCRADLLRHMTAAVKAQVEVFNQKTNIESITGTVTGLEAWVSREASDWTNAEDVKLTELNISDLLREIKPEK